MLREVMVKIRLERINTQKRVTVEALLDSRAIGYKFRICKKLEVQAEKNKKINLYKKYR